MNRAKTGFVSIFFIVLIGLAIYSFPVVQETITASSDIFDTANQIDQNLNQEIAFRNAFININGLMAKGLLLSELNNVIKLESGHLIEKNEKVDFDCYLENLKDLRQFANDNGAELLYVSLPRKNMMKDVKMPLDAYDASFDNIKSLFNTLERAGIEYLDLAARAAQSGKTSQELYYATDHHWNCDGAFWAVVELMTYLSEKYDFKIDEKLIDIDNYYRETFKDIMLGSYGKRVGVYYGGLDDIEILYPKFTMAEDIKYDVVYKDVVRKGGFKATAFDYTRAKPGDLFSSNGYATFLGGDYHLAKISNPNALNDKKVLWIKDSYSMAALPFLSLYIKDITMFDPRVYPGYALEDCIREVEPDYILMMHTYGYGSERYQKYFEYNPNDNPIYNSYNFIYDGRKTIPESSARELDVYSNFAEIARGKTVNFSFDFMRIEGKRSNDLDIEFSLECELENGITKIIGVRKPASYVEASSNSKYTYATKLPVDVKRVKRAIVGNPQDSRLQLSNIRLTIGNYRDDLERDILRYNENMLSPFSAWNYTILPKKAKFNATILAEALTPGTVYSISAQKIKNINEKANHIEFILRNGDKTVLDKIYFSSDITEKQQRAFYVPREAEGAYLEVYPSVEGNTSQKGVVIEKLKLEEGPIATPYRVTDGVELQDVFYREKIEINAGESENKVHFLFNKLQPNCAYQLSIAEINKIAGDAKYITIAVYDSNAKAITQVYCLETDVAQAHCYIDPIKGAEHSRIIIYPGLIHGTKGNRIELLNVKLTQISQ